MIIDPIAILISQLRNNILSKRNCSHNMKFFWVFITQFYFIGCIPLLPIDIFVLEEILKMIFENQSTIPFMQKEWSAVLYNIQKENDLITKLYQL